MKRTLALADTTRLREQARQILRDHVFDSTLAEFTRGELSLESLLEELHIYHAELLIQQEALRESHQANEIALSRFVRLYYELPTPALLVSWQGMVKETNAAATEQLALDRRLLTHLATLQHIPVLEQAFQKAKATGKAEVNEVQLRGAGKRTLTADLALIRLPGIDGEEAEFICTVVDQTERIAQREALRATTDVVDASSTVAFRWRAERGWPVLYASDNVRRWGYPLARFSSGELSFIDLVHPADRLRLEQTCREAVATRQSCFTTLHRVLWADGSEHWVEAHTDILHLYGDNEVHLQGLVTDVTERERARTALEHQLQAQGLLAEVSSLFVNSQAAEGDAHIRQALAHLGSFFNADHVYLAEFATLAPVASRLHEWCADGEESYRDDPAGVPLLRTDWCLGRLLQQRSLHLPELDALPGAAAADLIEFQQRSVQSLLAVALTADDRTLGLLGIDAVTAPGNWGLDDVRLVRLVAENITSMLVRRRSEGELLASEARYRQVCSIMTDVAYSCLGSADGQMTLDWITASVESLSGYGLDEVLSRGCWHFLLLPEDTDTFRQRIAGLACGETSTCELRLRHRDGSVRWVRATTECLSDSEHPGATRIYGGLVDITRHKTRETEIQRLALVVEQSPSIVMITDLDGVIEFVNQRFCEVTGYSRQDVEGRHLHCYCADSALDSSREGWHSITRGETWQGELQHRKQSGEVYWEQALVTPLRDEHGVISHLVKLSEDVSDKKALSEQLTYLIHYDPLTGLPNRALMRERIDRALGAARRDRHGLALLSVDLDRLKLVNDSLGHAAGDQLLRTVAQRMQILLGPEDTLARFGGDNFVLLVGQLRQVQDSVGLAERIHALLDDPIIIGRDTTRITASMGISLYPEDANSSEELIGHADAALHMAKSEGRRLYRFYTPVLNKQLLEQFQLEQALRYGLEQGEMRLVYQPRVDMRTGRILSLEALVRWQHPARGLIAPSRFIPIAESTGLILELGPIVLREACRQLGQWRTAGVPTVPIAVNLSANELYQEGLAQRIREITTEAGIAPAELEFEITESAAMRSIDQAVEILAEMRDNGFSLSIDDFGTGYASLSYLNRLPMHAIKIDRSFLAEVKDHADDATQGATIVKAIIGLGSNLGLHIIAEGVETATQRAFLLDHGCQVAQGFLFTVPLSAEEIEPLLRTGHILVAD